MTSTEMNPTLVSDTSGNIALQNKHTRTNVITMTAPHRCDLQGISCINKVYNRKPDKMSKNMNHVRIIDMNLTRNEFARQTTHELFK